MRERKHKRHDGASTADGDGFVTTCKSVWFIWPVVEGTW